MTTVARAPRGREIAAFATLYTAGALSSGLVPCLASSDSSPPQPSAPPRRDEDREREHPSDDEPPPPAAAAELEAEDDHGELLAMMRVAKERSRIASGREPDTDAWRAFLASPDGQALDEHERAALSAMLWPNGPPTVDSYARLLGVMRYPTEVRAAEAAAADSAPPEIISPLALYYAARFHAGACTRPSVEDLEPLCWGGPALAAALEAIERCEDRRFVAEVLGDAAFLVEAEGFHVALSEALDGKDAPARAGLGEHLATVVGALWILSATRNDCDRSAWRYGYEVLHGLAAHLRDEGAFRPIALRVLERVAMRAAGLEDAR